MSGIRQKETITGVRANSQIILPGRTRVRITPCGVIVAWQGGRLRPGSTFHHSVDPIHFQFESEKSLNPLRMTDSDTSFWDIIRTRPQQLVIFIISLTVSGSFS
jgi:hypothetical protein